jgi:hypothetical protein
MVSHSTFFAQKWVSLYLAAEFFSLRLPRSVARYIIQLYRNQPECIGDIPQLLGDFPKLFSDIPEDAILVLVHCRHTNLCAKKPLLACKEYVTLLWTTWCNVRIDFCKVSSLKNRFDETNYCHSGLIGWFSHPLKFWLSQTGSLWNGSSEIALVNNWTGLKNDTATTTMIPRAAAVSKNDTAWGFAKNIDG